MRKSSSVTVRFITRYMARVRRLRFFFIKRMIDRRFTVTIATDAVSWIQRARWCTRMISWLVIFSLHTFNSFFLSVARLPFRRIWKNFQLWTWTKKIDISFTKKITNGDTLGRWSTVSVAGSNDLVFIPHASLLKQRKFNAVFLFCKL